MLNQNNIKHDVSIQETPRLYLRPAMETDIDILYDNLFSDADVMKHLLFSEVRSPEAIKKFIYTSFTFTPTLIGMKVIVEKRTNSVIGFAGLASCQFLFNCEDFEIDYAIRKTCWGMGYATEIAKELKEKAFLKLKCSRLLATAHKKNIASQVVLTKLGWSFLNEIFLVDRGSRNLYSLELKH